jgi:hypothetical protein
MVLQSLVAQLEEAIPTSSNGTTRQQQNALKGFFVGRERWHPRPKSYAQRLDNIHEVFRAATAAFPDLPPFPAPEGPGPYTVRVLQNRSGG